MTLRDLPSVREEAEKRANDIHLRLFGRPTDGERLAQWREAHLDLLTDLSRADSRDAVARLVAEKVPNLQAWEVTAGCESGGGRLNMVLRACGMPEVDRWEPDPTPVDALRLIASKVLA